MKWARRRKQRERKAARLVAARAVLAAAEKKRVLERLKEYAEVLRQAAAPRGAEDAGVGEPGLRGEGDWREANGVRAVGLLVQWLNGQGRAADVADLVMGEVSDATQARWLQEARIRIKEPKAVGFGTV